MILIHSAIKPVKVKSWFDAYDNLRKRRKTYGAFSIAHNGLMYEGNYFAMRQFCRDADVYGVERASVLLHYKTTGLKLVANQ